MKYKILYIEKYSMDVITIAYKSEVDAIKDAKILLSKDVLHIQMHIRNEKNTEIFLIKKPYGYENEVSNEYFMHFVFWPMKSKCISEQYIKISNLFL